MTATTPKSTTELAAAFEQEAKRLLAEYKIPGIQDLPVVMGHEVVQARQSNGPFGAKGVGESATFGVASAIAEAIEDAVGVRLTTLPMKPETVFRAIAKANGQALANP